MKDSKTALSVAAVVLFGISLLIMLFYFKPPSSAGTVYEHHTAAAEDPVSTANTPRIASQLPDAQRFKPKSQQQAIASIIARRPFYRLDQQKVADALSKTAMWQYADPQKAFQVLPWLSEKQKTDGRSFIEYDPYVLESKFVGDQVDIFLPEIGLTAKAVIDDIQQIDDNIIRWQGHFIDFNDSQGLFSISQTLTDQYAVGSFQTPLRNFNMESKNGMGWVVNQEKDFFLPENGQDAVHPEPH